MQNIYAFYLKAKQKSGAPSLFIWFEAKNDARAKRDLENYIEDAELESANYFKPVRTNYPVVDDLPEERQFCDKWCTLYELDDTNTWQPIPAVGGQQQVQQKSAGEFFASNLDKHTVIAAAWLYGRDCLKLNTEQLKAAKALVMDDAQRYPQNVILALSSLKQFEHTYPEMPITAIAGMKAIWPPFDKAPELGKLCQFATEYLDAPVDKRADVINKWSCSAAVPAKPVEQIEPAAVADETPRTKSGAILTDGSLPSKGTPIDSLQMLETVIGCALYPSDFDIANPPGSIIRAVTEMKKRRDPKLHAWNEMLSNSPGILQCSREAIVDLVRGADENLYMTPGALLTYINTTLTDFDVPARPAPEVTETAEVPAEKTSAETSEYEPPRRVWLRRAILDALDGKTHVMSEDDAEELLSGAGDFSKVYFARLLAKELEPRDPFSELVEDDVYHITFDVLENWIEGKDQRSEFINERVTFTLRERYGSNALQQQTPDVTQGNAVNEVEKVEVAQQQEKELRSLGGGHFDVSTLFETSPLAIVATEETFLADDQPQKEPDATTVPAYFEPGRYHDIPNDVYHSADGISSTMAKDARISLMYYHGRHVIKTIQRERTDALTFGSLVHTLALEPEKLDAEFSVEPVLPEGAFTDTASMRAFIDHHNATLPKQADADTLRRVIEEHNATLPAPFALGGNAEEIGQFYMMLPAEFQSIPDGAKMTATTMKACIKQFNATLPVPLKTTGGRDALLEQLETIDPVFVEKERAIPAPLPVSGSKEEMAARIKTILPTAVFADELISAWKDCDDGRQQITQQQLLYAKAIQRALFTHPSAGQLLQHPHRAVEVSYFGIDEDTGLEVRVRPDLEIEAGGLRSGFDLKTVSMGNVKQSALRARLHREIIERDYHLSAGMYCDVAAFDQFFWIFVNKDENYHWVAIVEASADLLELGRLEYRKTLRDIKQAQDTGLWPEPITEEIVDDINDFDQRRMEALRVA